MKYILLLSLMLTGCGISDSLKTLPEMKSSVGGMKQRLDTIGKGIDSMNTEVKGLGTSLKGMSNGIDSVKSGIHSQSVLLLLTELSKQSKYVSLTSINPIEFVAAGKSLAELATPEELSGIFFLWLTEINTGSNDNLTKQQKNDMDLSKMNKLVALQTIAAFIPDKILTGLIKENIEKSNQYEETTYGIFALRHTFISVFLLDVTTSQKMTSPSSYELALGFMDQLKSIQKLSFVGSIQLKLVGFYDTGKLQLNQTIKIEDKDLNKLQHLLINKLDKELNTKYINTERVRKIKQTLLF